MNKVIIFFLICILVSIVSCSVIELPNNCGKTSKETFAVLPFVSDEYCCNLDVENKIRNLCYNIENGITLLNEYSRLVNKSLSEIEIDEFCDYAKSKGVDYIVIGTTRIEWIEGRKPNGPILQINNSTNSSEQERKSLEMDVYNLITGNYATIDCYTINTTTKNKKELFRNYKVKKVSVGMPNSISSNN